MLAGYLQAADVSCEWAVADKPRNLAEGAVAVEYDAEGAIQSIVASHAGAVADQFFQVEFWGKALKRVEN